MLSVAKKIQVLKSDRLLFAIFLIHLLLAFFHMAYSFYTENQPTQCYIRASFCTAIALATFLFLRAGFSITILAYAGALLYFNNFFIHHFEVANIEYATLDDIPDVSNFITKDDCIVLDVEVAFGKTRYLTS